MLSAARSGSYFEELRWREFGRLERQQHAYLDYTGSALYAESQLRAHQELLADSLFGNPHSDSRPSRTSTEAMDAARDLVLGFFGVDSSTHAVCFTANTTAAIKLVAESYPFSPGSACVLAADNHNSVNGIREYARRAGTRLRTLPLDDELRLAAPEDVLAYEGGGVLAFPAQSNFSGVRHPLSLVSSAKELGYDVLLDAAAFVPSHPLSLAECPADFVALSFYKLFGYPTGLGALVARRDALAQLRRPWFAGGTVLYASIDADTHRLRAGHEGFEDGTPDFLGIAALPAGFALLDAVGMRRLSAHVSELTALLLTGLRAMAHVEIYGPRDTRQRGGTVAFNVRGVPFPEVEARAANAGISVRGGCFCNPGASEKAFGIADAGECLSLLGDAFTVEAFAACTGRRTGAVRASVGMATNADDVRRLLDVVGSFGS